MAFNMPEYKAPDFGRPELKNAPDCLVEPADMDGVAPENYHSTSMFPEYFKIDGEWKCVAKAYNQNSNTISK